MASSTSWVHLLVAFAAPLATTRAASLIEAGRDGWTASGTRYVVIRDLDPENSGADTTFTRISQLTRYTPCGAL